MSQPGYSHLEEELEEVGGADMPPMSDSAPWVATFDEELNTRSLTDDPCGTPWPECGTSHSHDVSSPFPGTSKSMTSCRPHESYSAAAHDVVPAANVKYTPLTFVKVQELTCDGEEHDVSKPEPEVYDSTVQLDLRSKKRFVLSRCHVLVCGVMCASVALVTLAMLYAFVILPSHSGKIVYPDGKTHASDILKLRKLGENVVITSCGIVRGTREGGASVFRGIPYAKPPSGDGRWRPPTPLSYESGTCWSDVYNATSYGSKCVQPHADDVTKIQGSEDCLYLNVWTPSLNPAVNLPVMVWLHSGDFVSGSGHEFGMTPGPDVAVATNSVYVSFNFRLGAFGFLAVDPLRDGWHGTAGNYGLMDQQLALHWVKDNIRHFGGNEEQVTIFGHGSGATSGLALLTSPYSNGLFHKAWLTSPIALVNKTLEEACQDNVHFLVHTDCHSTSCMRRLTPEQVTAASPWPLAPRWTVDQLVNPSGTQLRNDLVVFDGHVLHSSIFKEGSYLVEVPVILGTAYFDLSSLNSVEAAFNLTWDDYDTWLIHHVSVLGTGAAVQSKSLYSTEPRLKYTGSSHFPARPTALLASLLGDLKTVCPIKLAADTLVKLDSSPVYLYVTELYPSHQLYPDLIPTRSRDSGPSTPFIGWDIVAFLNTFSDFGFSPGQSDVNFQNIVREEVMSFVKDGRPDAARWATVDINSGLIAREVTITPAVASYFHRCDFWRQHGFFRYTWSEA